MKEFKDILDEAAELQAQGMEEAEVLAKFPEFKDELKELWEVLDKLVMLKDTKPSKELLVRALAVTKAENSRLLAQEGKTSLTIMERVDRMANKLKLLLPVGAMVALVVAIVLVRGTGTSVPNSDLSKITDKAVPAANGSVDTTVQAFESELQLEADAIAADEASAFEAAAANASYNNLGDSIDENSI
jgi:hypothetical protein